MYRESSIKRKFNQDKSPLNIDENFIPITPTPPKPSSLREPKSDKL